MSVLLVGIGADTTNCTPTPPVFDDGRFEYIPIPERSGPSGTTEHRTYGNTPLQHADTSLAGFVERIYPTGQPTSRRTGDAIANWPLHHDPNLEALSYGETISRASYVHRLRDMEPGDVVAFYTGLQAAANGPRHRYLIGAFTVNMVFDCQRIPYNGSHRPLRELPKATRTAHMESLAENAHAKRFLATGELLAPDDGVVIVDGREPGKRFERAVQISADGGGPHYYLRDELEEKWQPESTGDARTSTYLGGIKPAILLDISPASFWETVEAYLE